VPALIIARAQLIKIDFVKSYGARGSARRIKLHGVITCSIDRFELELQVIQHEQHRALITGAFQ
jgi:hypothetical protein